MSRLLMASLAATAFLFSTAADAKPQRTKPTKVSYTHVVTCDKQGCREVREPLQASYKRALKRFAHKTRPKLRIAGKPASKGAPVDTGLIAEARRYLGGNPTGRSSLWCATFMNFVLERTGHKGTGSNLARSFASYGTRVSGPQVGAIAVMSRGRGGGHVGIVSGIDSSGNPIIISGNHGRRVAEATYRRERIYAYVIP